MKAITFFSFALISWTCSAQENPWLPQGENPWKSYPENQIEIVVVKDTAKRNNDIALIQSNGSESHVISDSVKIEMSEPDATVFYSNDVLIDKAQLAAFENYKSAKDFVFGFTMGLAFNFTSLIFIDPIYIAVNSNKEKVTMNTIEKDSIYAPVDDKILHKKVRSEVKIKKPGQQ